MEGQPASGGGGAPVWRGRLLRPRAGGAVGRERAEGHRAQDPTVSAESHGEGSRSEPCPVALLSGGGWGGAGGPRSECCTCGCVRPHLFRSSVR